MAQGKVWEDGADWEDAESHYQMDIVGGFIFRGRLYGFADNLHTYNFPHPAEYQ